MSSKKGMFGMMAYMMMESMNGGQMHNHKPKQKIRKPKLNKEHKGHKKFTYGDEVIYALNQKNADKKAKTKGLI